MDPERWRQIELLCHAALEREASERPAFLQEACAGDEELRREVESLLQYEGNGTEWLERPGWELAPSAVESPAAPDKQQLAQGTQLGPYRIEEKIGAGGMGIVYRAVDTRLNRSVAMKFLNASVAEADRRRFEREAQVLASLNHPHIGAIYGLEESDSVRALVMELVDGPTLADRIRRGPIPFEEAMQIAAQIAEALEAAHEKGVIHRDLKPANVKITPEGVVKVLDFGLAKSVQEPTAQDPLPSAAATDSLTRDGAFLGTAAYMSPEQARGQAVDKRADVWAFGVVLYEMLSGRHLFQRETIFDTLAAVLKEEPDLTQVPGRVRRLLQLCLRKDPRQRLRSIGDARLLLDNTFEGAPDAIPLKSTSPWAGVAAALMVALAIALWAPWRGWRVPEASLQPLARLEVDLGSELAPGSTLVSNAIISADGTRLVYVAQSRLFTRRLDQPKASELTGTEDASHPFFSPDGKWVAFFASGKLKKILLEGGAVSTLCDAPSGHGGSWGEDGNIIASLTGLSGLSRIPSAGGAPMPMTELAHGERGHNWPQILPGGKAVLFTATASTAGAEGHNIEVVTLQDGRTKTLLRGRGAARSRYFPSGHLVYLNSGALYAAPFDAAALEVRGTPVPVVEDVAQFDFSQTGTVIYRTGGSGLRTVQWLSHNGDAQPLLPKPGNYIYPRLSPDGGRLAFSSSGDVHVYDWRQKTMTRLTFDGGHFAPVWTPDGRYVLFSTPAGMFWTRADGASKPQQLTHNSHWQNPGAVTADGKRLVFHELSPETGYDLWTMTLESDRAGLKGRNPELFLQTSFDEMQPSFSPDGRWIAYTSNESLTRVYVRAFPDKGGKWQISGPGGKDPVWSRNAGELFFRNGTNQIMVVAYTVKGDSFVPGEPRIWSAQTLAGAGLNYDVAPDGRIAALVAAEDPEGEKARQHVIFLQNFFDELRRRVPVKKN